MSSIDRMMKDYELEEIEEAGGKVRRRYVYRGDRYERQVTPIQRRRERYAGVLAALLAGGATLFAAVQDTPANKSGFFGVISVLSLLPVIGVLTGAVVAFFRKGDLTAGEYRERRLLLTAMPLLGTVLLLLLAVGYALHRAYAPLLAALLSAGLYGLTAIRELKVKYTVHPGRQTK